MSRKKIECITCDRCNKVYEENDNEATADDSGNAELTLESKAGDVSFDDLCNKCKKRVADLIGQIRMDSKEKKEGESTSPDEKTDPA